VGPLLPYQANVGQEIRSLKKYLKTDYYREYALQFRQKMRMHSLRKRLRSGATGMVDS
jgi:hypothetical protein